MSTGSPKRTGLGWFGRKDLRSPEPADRNDLASAQETESSRVEPGAAQEPAPRDGRSGWLSRLTGGLSKSSARLTDGLTGLFTKRKLDAASLDDLEDLLIEADLGVAVAGQITQTLRKGRYQQGISAEDVRGVLATEIERVLNPVAQPLIDVNEGGPRIILFVGVNGSGKTTTIGKVAQRLRHDGRSVLMVAGDTFRAAAIDQLRVWGERTGARVLAREAGADPAGLAYDAIFAARRDKIDTVLIDTAGRLQNKAGLMDELEKVVRVLRKFDPALPHDVVLVLDATTGQNALNQVDIFRERAGVTGLMMTKLDGTARGGILVAIADKFGLPIYAIGVGEGAQDLQPFSARDFSRALLQD